jgi:hypothetical protein
MRFVTDLAALQEQAGGPPKERSLRKQLDHLDESARRFIAAAPFCVPGSLGGALRDVLALSDAQVAGVDEPPARADTF